MRVWRALPVFIAAALVLVPWASAADIEITVPQDMTVEAQTFAGTAVSFVASAVDDDGHPVPVACIPASGSIFPLGTTTVTCTAGSAKQAERKRFKITVVDTTPPAITVPNFLTVRTSSRSGAPASWTATATDRVDGPVPVSCTPAPKTVFPVGETQVTCSSADRRSNTASAAFYVRVVLIRTVKRSALLAPVRGATVSAPPLLQWRPMTGAKFYNVQVYRLGRKVLTTWPTRPRYRMQRSWTHNGRTYRFRPGVYVWYVWPARGTLARPNYGRLLGQSSFRVV